MSCGGNWDGNMPEENYCRNCRKVSLFVREAGGGWWRLVAAPSRHHHSAASGAVQQTSPQVFSQQLADTQYSFKRRFTVLNSQ